jgi:hypothetical protein
LRELDTFYSTQSYRTAISTLYRLTVLLLALSLIDSRAHPSASPSTPLSASPSLFSPLTLLMRAPSVGMLSLFFGLIFTGLTKQSALLPVAPEAFGMLVVVRTFLPLVHQPTHVFSQPIGSL